MKWPAVILICSGISYGAVQITNCKKHEAPIRQRMVQVIEIGDHPPREYVIWENVSE